MTAHRHKAGGGAFPQTFSASRKQEAPKQSHHNTRDYPSRHPSTMQRHCHAAHAVHGSGRSLGVAKPPFTARGGL